MDTFSLGNAWSKGFAFVTQQAVNFAIILIGIGVLLPFGLQLAMTSGPIGMMNPAMMAQGGLGAVSTIGGALLLVMLISYVLQMGSYFASWRLGFDSGETLGGAIAYGLIAAVLLFVAIAVVSVALIAGLSQVSPGAAALLFVLVLLPLFAAVYTVMAALVAIVMFLVLLLVLAFGSSMGEMNPVMGMTGGGAVAMLIGLAIIALLFWLTARFSCATSIIAERKSYNLLEGLAASWRTTATNQWRIMGYLALLGVVLMVILFTFAMVMGASMMGGLQSGGTPSMGMGSSLLVLILGVVFAYLTVLVPAGIYRELCGTVGAEKVFA